jgi:hypothetical protein
MTMRARTIAAAAFLAAAFVGRAGAQSVIVGAVNSVEPGRVVIDGQAYAVSDATEFKTVQGGRFAPHELREGVPVEAEVGDGGELVVLKADLVR